MGKGSGSVTSFSRADGFVRIGRNTELVEADTPVEVTLIGRDVAVADLVVIGSHCAGLDLIASELARHGLRHQASRRRLPWRPRGGFPRRV